MTLQIHKLIGKPAVSSWIFKVFSDTHTRHKCMNKKLTQLLNIQRTPTVLLSCMIILAPNIFDCEATGLPGKTLELVRSLWVFSSIWSTFPCSDKRHWMSQNLKYKSSWRATDWRPTLRVGCVFFIEADVNHLAIKSAAQSTSVLCDTTLCSVVRLTT